MSGQGAGLEVPWSRRHRERLLTEEVVPWSVVRTAADGVVPWCVVRPGVRPVRRGGR
ncbi:hypothetical protein PV779_10715 [Streptomyces sp. ID01-9D]|nr:hypothetical protein [Streptomyces sp. ID01-9D]